jgi:hypothetical protein
MIMKNTALTGLWAMMVSEHALHGYDQILPVGRDGLQE